MTDMARKPLPFCRFCRFWWCYSPSRTTSQWWSLARWCGAQRSEYKSPRCAAWWPTWSPAHGGPAPTACSPQGWALRPPGGGALIGWLYDISIGTLVVVVIALELMALVMMFAIRLPRVAPS